MRQVVIERVIRPILLALRQPQEQFWVGITFVTLVVAVFSPGKNGTSTRTIVTSPIPTTSGVSQYTSQSGSTSGSGPVFNSQNTKPKTADHPLPSNLPPEQTEASNTDQTKSVMIYATNQNTQSVTQDAQLIKPAIPIGQVKMPNETKPIPEPVDNGTTLH